MMIGGDWAKAIRSRKPNHHGEAHRTKSSHRKPSRLMKIVAVGTRLICSGRAVVFRKDLFRTRHLRIGQPNKSVHVTTGSLADVNHAMACRSMATDGSCIRMDGAGF
ncbi:MAG: hypothetical protein AAGA32_10385, partial [Pseudomonadota bacterium]